MKNVKTILAFWVLATIAHANANSLAEIGSAEALNGKVLYSTGKLIVDGDGGAAINPIKGGSIKKSKDMQSLTPSLNACRNGTAKVSVNLESMGDVENIAFFTNTSLGSKGNVNVAVVRIKKADDANDTFNFKPIEIRVYDGEEIIAKARIEDGIFPCALVVGSFIPKRDDQQLALSWISPGGSGYTAGVTVYSLQ